MVTESSFPSGLAINRSLPPFSSAGTPSAHSQARCRGARAESKSGADGPDQTWRDSPHCGEPRCPRSYAVHHRDELSSRFPCCPCVRESLQADSDDLHIAMRMRGKTMAGLHPIFVDDSKGAESHVVRIVILIE